jgi:hypothetical protein
MTAEETLCVSDGTEDTRLGPNYEVEAEHDELVEGLKQCVFLESGIPQPLKLHDNLLQGHLTRKQDVIDEVVDRRGAGCVACSVRRIRYRNSFWLVAISS